MIDDGTCAHDPGISDLKTDVLLHPLRHEARFRAVEAALKFPQ
jgi:hypothetical protein